MKRMIFALMIGLSLVIAPGAAYADMDTASPEVSIEAEDTSYNVSMPQIVIEDNPTPMASFEDFSFHKHNLVTPHSIIFTVMLGTAVIFLAVRKRQTI